MSPTPINLSSVLIVACVVWLLDLGHVSAAINLNQHKQHSTISSETSPFSGQETQQGLRQQASNSETNSNNPSDSLDDLMNDKYLDSPLSASNQLDIAANLIVQEELADKHNSQNTIQKPAQGKTSRRQMEQQQKVADWWSNLMNENKTKRPPGDAKSGARQPTKAPKSVIYREQPIEQNQLITIRHQLMAIRDKHRMLMFKSVPQLIQLDQKLTDSYKLCLKRKMPLYAGMLYRTRDYVVRMANEVVHERQVLEAVAKQIQKVLRQKAQNTTLVRAYNRQLATMGNLAMSDSNSGSSLAATTDSIHQVQQQRPSSTQAVVSHDNLTVENEPAGKLSRRTSSNRTPSVAAPIWDDDAENETLAISEPAGELVNQKVYNRARDSKVGELKDESGQADRQVQADPSQRTLSNNEQVDSNSADDKSRLKFKNLSKKVYNENQRPYGEKTSTEGISEGHSWISNTTKKPKQRFYTVNINEVNLKKELTKAQALIDRINASSHELMTVADDIVFLFKLTSDNQNAVKNIAASARRLKKMTLKTPIQSLFERQSRLMNMVNPSDLNTNNLPEMKPLFDTPSFTSYKDPVDIDLGFDSPAILDT